MTTASQQDIRRVIPPDGEQNVMARGVFVFYKVGRAAISVVINDERVEMEPGDVRRVEEPFKDFLIQNTTGIEQDVQLVAGFGDYRRLIVRGELSSLPVILGADGIPRPDTRRTVGVQIGLDPSKGYSVEKFEKTDYELPTLESNPPGQARFDLIYQGQIVYVDSYDYIYIFDDVTGEELAQEPINADIRYMYHPSYGAVVLDRSAREWLSFVGSDMGRRGEMNTITSYSVDATINMEATFLLDGRLAVPDFSDLVIYPGLGQMNSPIVMEGVLDQRNSGTPIFADPNDRDLIYWPINNSSISVRQLNIKTGEVTDYANVYDTSRVRSATIFNEDLFFHGDGKFYPRSATFWGRGAVREITQLSAAFKPTVYDVEKTGIAGQSYDELTHIWETNAAAQALAAYREIAGLGRLPSNYRDYIHSLKINGRTVADTGYESFERAGVDDYFRVDMPAIIEITASREVLT